MELLFINMVDFNLLIIINGLVCCWWCWGGWSRVCCKNYCEHYGCVCLFLISYLSSLFFLSSVVVAKRTSVFDDPTMEIQELTAVIKQDITALNSAVVDLQFLSNSRHESGNISSDTTSHSTTVVDDLKNRLMSTTKEFKEVLTMRTEVRPSVAFILVCPIRLLSEWESIPSSLTLFMDSFYNVG